MVEALGEQGRHGFKVESIDMRFFTWLIGMLDHQRMLKQAFVVLDKIKTKVKPDTIIYTKLIKSCSKHNRLKRAILLEEEMHSLGVVADQRTLSAMMEVYSKMGNIDQVKALRAEMESRHLPLDSFNYGSMIRVYSRNARVDNVLALWEEIKGREQRGQLEVDLHLYTIAIEALGQNRMLDEMLKMWEELKQRGKAHERLRPDVVAYTALIDNLGHNGEIERMLETLNEMKEEAIQHEMAEKRRTRTRTFNMKLEQTTSKDLITPTSAGIKSKETSLYPSARTYACVLNHLSSAGSLEKIEKIDKEIKENPSLVNVRVLTALLSGYGKVGELALMDKVYRSMIQQKMQPSAYTYTTLVGAFTKHGSAHDVVKLWNQMKNKLFVPDGRLWHSLVQGLGSKNGKEMLEVFWYMKAQKQHATRFIYTRLIDSLKDLREDKEMERVVVEMEKDGVEPDYDTCHAIAAMWARRGNHENSSIWISKSEAARGVLVN